MIESTNHGRREMQVRRSELLRTWQSVELYDHESFKYMEASLDSAKNTPLPAIMDPLSILAGVGGLVSLALQINQIVHHCILDVRDAPDLAKQVVRETIVWSAIFEKLQGFLQTPRARPVDHTINHALQGTLEACVETFSKLEAMVHRLYSEFTRRGCVDWASKKTSILELLESLNTEKDSIGIFLQFYEWYVTRSPTRS